eukprot:3348934-Amphidinium_carterae.1
MGMWPGSQHLHRQDHRQVIPVVTRCCSRPGPWSAMESQGCGPGAIYTGNRLIRGILPPAVLLTTALLYMKALKKNPYAPAVPCHRVIRADGTLGGGHLWKRFWGLGSSQHLAQAILVVRTCRTHACRTARSLSVFKYVSGQCAWMVEIASSGEDPAFAGVRFARSCFCVGGKFKESVSNLKAEGVTIDASDVQGLRVRPSSMWCAAPMQDLGN